MGYFGSHVHVTVLFVLGNETKRGEKSLPQNTVAVFWCSKIGSENLIEFGMQDLEG